MKYCTFESSSQKLKIIVVLIFSFATCFSQSIKFENYSSNNGLVYNYVRNIAKDIDGFLWVGTNRGLSRFDGYSFKNYTKHGLRSPWVSHLLKDKKGKLWITTEGGICYYDKVDDNFKYISKENELKVFGSAPIFEDSEGKLWVTAENGLFLIENNILLPTNLNKINEPHTIFEDHKNQLWIGSNDGLIVYNYKTKTTKSFPLITPSWRFFVNTIFPENDFQILLGTDSGLLLFDTEKGTFEQLSIPEEKNKNIVITSITNFQSSKSFLSCGTTNNGVLIFDKEKRRFNKQFATSLFETNGLPSNTVNTFFEDNQILWIGTNLGLSKLNLSNQQFQTVKLKELYERKSLDQITRIIEDKTNKKMWWIATNDERGRLLYYDSETKNIVKFHQIIDKNSIKKLVNTTIRDLIFDKKGRLWIATFNGIYLMKNDEFQHFQIDKNKNIDAYILKFDKNENLWIGSENGLFSFDINTYTFENHQKNIKTSISTQNFDQRKYPIETFDFDKKDNIFLGTQNGIIFYNPITKENKRFYIKNDVDSITLNRVSSIIYDKNKLIYSTLSGLIYLDLLTLKTKIIRPEKNFYIYSIVQDSLKNVWISTYKGVCKIDNFTQKVRYFNTNDGLFNDYSLFRINKIADKFIMPFTGAFTEFHPMKISFCNTILKPLISDVETGKKRQNIHSQNTVYQAINANFDENNIVIKFTAIDYCNPEKIQFRYKLEGLENEWIMADKNRQANYTNLDFKTYEFRLQVADEQGEWSKKEAVLMLKIIPPFYQTWWFKSLIISILAGLVYAFYRFRIDQIVKLQAMRNRIAADLHDEVGSTLSSISIMSEMAAFKKDFSKEKLLEISSNAREMIEKMDDIVWAINPQNDEFYNLETRLKNFAIPLFESKGIEFTFLFPLETENLKLNMEYRRNIYLIFKEAVTNLIKYSLCKKVEFKCILEDNQLIISILDDGIGFDSNKKSDRNGLKNMRERAKNIGGKLIILSKIDEGTKIELIISL